MSIIQGNTKVSAGGYNIAQSIRFNDNDSAYLYRTFGTATSLTTTTLSLWVKRCNLGTDQRLMVGSTSAYSDSLYFRFTSADILEVLNGPASLYLRTTQVFRDTSAWYHIVFVFDTSNATSSERFRFYVNGERITAVSASYPSLNQTFKWNSSTGEHSIGCSLPSPSVFADMYMAEINFIDGQALAPTDFGEFNDDGVWIPKQFAGTYGNNGFYITGENSADLGADYSGNGNNFTSSGLTTADQVTDTPTDNYPVISPIDRQSGASAPLSDGNLKFTNNNTGTAVDARATFAVSSGKWYWEIEADILGQSGVARENVGVVSPQWRIDSGTGGTFFTVDPTGYGFGADGQKRNNNVASAYGSSWTAGDIIGVALDLDNGKIWWSLNGTFQNSGNPAAGTGEAYSGLSGTYAPAFSVDYGTGVSQIIANFGQTGGLTYTPPTGFKALSTANLPTPTIKDGSTNFNSYTWIGNGGGQRIASFQPITETYTINNSARFNDNDSAYLSKLWGSAGNKKTFTYSLWIKRGNLGSVMDLVSFEHDVPIILAATDEIWISLFNATRLVTRRLFRDASAWYHIVLTVDSTNATSGDRIKLYINGVRETDFSTESYPSLNADAFIYTPGLNQYIGRLYGGSNYFDGYISDMYYLDGVAADASSFGQYDASTNRWVPKAYSGGYGTNGYFLEFGDSAALGDDTSGNGNDFTSSGLTTADQVTDTPTENYCVLNVRNEYGTSGFMGCSDGNLRSSPGGVTTNKGWRSTIGPTSGKWYCEATFTATLSDNNGGVALTTGSGIPGETSDPTGIRYMDAGTWRQNGVSVGILASVSVNDVVMMAFDVDAGKVWFGKNGSWYASGDPANGLNPISTTCPSPAFPASYHYTNSAITTWNFGQLGFTYTPPDGFVALNTDNLPLTGGNISAFSWIKSRSSGSYNHQLYDRVRDVTKVLASNSTAAETTDANGLQTFLLDGFQLGSSTSVNASGVTYVGWNWMTNTSGSGSTNTDGSITSTVLADTTAGFSVLTYSGSGITNDTVGHGLGVKPSVVIVKPRNAADNWIVNDWSGDYANKLKLNATDSTSSAANFVNAASSTTFTLGSDINVNGSGRTFVAYCWNEVEGFSKFGNYTGNGSTDGPFVWCGFRPAFVVVKNISQAAAWGMFDNKRIGYNADNFILFANNTNAETTTPYVDFLSNGFKLRRTGTVENVNGNTHIFMAFAEHPFGGSNVAPVPAR